MRGAIELIASACGTYQAWAHEGERHLLVLADGEDTPAFVIPVKSAARAQELCNAAQDEHLRNDSVFLVNFHLPAQPVAQVRPSRDYGGNGSVGRAKSAASRRRETRDMAAAEGIDTTEPPALRAWAVARREKAWAEMDMWNRVVRLAKTA